MRRSLTKLIVLSIPLSMFCYGCFDKPGDLVAPSWDVNMNIPILDKTYTLKDVIEKDTSFLKWYPESSPLANQIYYADKHTIVPVTIGDKVKLDNAVSSVTSKEIGEIKIQDPPAINTNVDIKYLDPNINPGSTMPVPPENNISIAVSFPQLDQYNYLKLSSGNATLSLKNAMPSPVEITATEISLVNTTDGITVGAYSGAVTIPSGQTKNIDISLNPGVTINNQFKLTCKLSTPGSGGAFVQIPQNLLNLSAALSNLDITEVNGKLKGNTVTTNGSVLIDQQTQYTNVEISQGALKLAIKNNIDVAFNAKVKLNNLYADKNSTLPYEMNIRVERKSSALINQPLNNFVLKSNAPSSNIDYQVIVTTEATNDFRTINSTNSFTDTVGVSQLSIRQFTGIVKPTKLDVKPTSVSLNLKDLKTKFKFNKINFKNPEVKIYMKPSSQFKLRFDGEITAKGTSNKLSFTDYISRTGTQVDSVISIPSQDLANFLSGFTPNLPDELYINGSATVNPDFDKTTLYSFANTDSVTGYAEVKFPLNLGIENGEFSDTSDYGKDMEDSKKDIEKIQSVVLSLDITNGLAAQVRFQGSILDPTKNVKLLDLFPNRQPQYIELPAAQVDNSGQVVAPSSVREVIELKGNDIRKFLDGKFMISNVTLNTSGALPGNPQPVEFKITDAIKIKASVKMVYKVSFDKQ